MVVATIAVVANSTAKEATTREVIVVLVLVVMCSMPNFEAAFS